MPDGRTLNFVKHGLLLGVPGKAELFTQHPIGMPESSCSMQDYRNRRRLPWQHEDTPPGFFGPPLAQRVRLRFVPVWTILKIGIGWSQV